MVITNTSHIAAVPYVRFGPELKYEAGNWDIHLCWGQEINCGPTFTRILRSNHEQTDDFSSLKPRIYLITYRITVCISNQMKFNKENNDFPKLIIDSLIRILIETVIEICSYPKIPSFSLLLANLVC